MVIQKHETVIQIFKTYTETRIRCYICIISRILADSYQMNKMEYEWHVFIESLYSDIRLSYSKNRQENFVLYSPVFCKNTEEYGAKSSWWLYVVRIKNNYKFLGAEQFFVWNVNKFRFKY